MSEKEFIELGKKHPEFLAYNSEQIAELIKKGEEIIADDLVASRVFDADDEIVQNRLKKLKKI